MNIVETRVEILEGHLTSNHYCFMTLTFYSFILGKTILRSQKLDDIETWNQQKKGQQDVSLIVFQFIHKYIKPERIYNPITAMGFSAMFTFQLDNSKK